MTPAERDAARQAIAALRPVIVAAAPEGGPPLAEGLAVTLRDTSLSEGRLLFGTDGAAVERPVSH